MSRVIIYGGGGHAKVVLDCLMDQGKKVEAVVDSMYSGDLLGVQRVPADSFEKSPDMTMVIAIGDNQVRKRISQSIQTHFLNVIHPTALVSAYAVVGEGCMILHRAIVQAGTRIGSHVIINTAAQVDHDCAVQDFAHIAPGAVLCGSVVVGEGALVGAGAVLKPGVRIGKWTTIGSGAVVVRDIPDFSVAVGNPARVIKQRDL